MDFDVRGGIVLRAAEIYRRFPSRTRPVPVSQTCRRLHFLCAAICGVPHGTKVGSLLMRYTDGTTADLPLRYDVNLGGWWHNDGKPESNGSVVAWTGQNPVAAPFLIAITSE